MADNFDASGLMPGSAPWQLPPDMGMEANNCTPRHGGDINCTLVYPSQEPRHAAEWPRDGSGFTMTIDTQKGY